MRSRTASIMAAAAAFVCAPLVAQEPELVEAFAFNAAVFDCATPNAPGAVYTTVHHSANSCAAHDALAYDAGRGWGYEVISPGDPDRNCAEQFGPFDDSPNTRAQFAAGCPNDLYDSFIGAKTFSALCQDLADPDASCEDLGIEPEGIIFRVDVPNGEYRFVAAVGSADNPHAHRILAEDGGSGRPTFSDQLNDHVVLVNNFDQNLEGNAVVPYSFARVGFGCFVPPAGSGPTFVNMDEFGFATDAAADCPTLTVTQGYIRFHQLQGNASNDANGGNFVLLEIWNVDGVTDFGSGATATIARSFDPNPYEPNAVVTVTLTAVDVPGATAIVETVPAGWTIQNAGGGAQNGQVITFNVAANNDTVSYTVRAPADCATPANFDASVTPAGGCESFVSSTPGCRPPGCGLDPSTGAVTAMLQIGPIDLGQGASDNGGTCNDTDLDGNNFSAKDYLEGGGVNETNVLVAEGDDLAPDFDPTEPTTGGIGVKLAVNPLINPDGASGILTVWRAAAGDAQGLIDYNLADNLGDPVDDYIIFSLVYLNNTTAGCLPIVLEVGSDDAVKMRVNGALVHANSICRGIPAYGAGDRVPVSLAPGVNVVLIGVVERGGGTGVRLALRDEADQPLTDGSVTVSCDPPGAYPTFPVISRSIVQDSQPDGGATVTLTTSGLVGTATVVETLPAGVTVSNAGGGTVNGNQLTLNIAANGDRTYMLSYPADGEGRCPFLAGTISGAATFSAGCGALAGDDALSCVNPPCPFDPTVEAELEIALYFGSRDLSVTNPDFLLNEISGAEYEGVIQTGDPLSVIYDPEFDGLPYGYLPFYADVAGLLTFELEDRGYEDLPPAIHTNITAQRAGWEIYGAFDDSPNGRNKYPDTTQEEIYDSFIGCKDFLATCNQAVNNPADPDVPCADGNSAPVPADGIIFRVDVPNGQYRFAAAVGDADNVHAHRLIAEDGGDGPPSDGPGDNHVVLISNFDQAQQTIGEADAAEPGEGVHARVGFAGRIPPLGDGVFPSPQFVDMDANGLATSECADSPTLTVTQGYIRFRALQGNSNDGPGGPRDPNGGDLVILEIWRVGGGGEPVFRRGDTDAVGAINLTDGVFLLNFLFLGGPAPPCMDAADANDSGPPNITTGVYIFNWLFLGGPLPPAPGPTSCGPDPTADALDCADYNNC